MGKIGTKRTTTNEGGSSSGWGGGISRNDDDDNADELCSPTSSAWLCCGASSSVVDNDTKTDSLSTATLGLTSYANFQNRPIGWYRKKRISAATTTSSPPSLSKSRDVVATEGDWYDEATQDVSGWFMEDMGSLFGNTPPPSSSSKEKTTKATTEEMAEMKYVAVLATMTINDTIDNGPVIEIRTLDDDDNGSNGNSISSSYAALQEYILTGKPWWEGIKNKIPTTVVPLYVIDTVTTASNQWGNYEGGKIVIHAASTNNATSSSSTTSSMNKEDGIIDILNNMMIGISGFNSNRRELLRFDPLPQLPLSSSQINNSKTTTPDSRNDDSIDDYSIDTIVEQLQSLVITNRQIMAQDIINGKTIVAPKSSTPGYIASTSTK
jgi:hypothetical protein